MWRKVSTFTVVEFGGGSVEITEVGAGCEVIVYGTWCNCVGGAKAYGASGQCEEYL